MTITPAQPPEGEFVTVSVELEYACGVKVDGTVACWGEDRFDSGLLTPPDGEFVTVSVGSHSACGVKVDGTVACWGGKASAAPEGEFVSVSAGYSGGHSYTCGVKADGTVACWYWTYTD